MSSKYLNRLTLLRWELKSQTLKGIIWYWCRYSSDSGMFGGEMGRGRSKAKETKVARNLKYSKSTMDLDRLAKELHGELKSNVNDEITEFDNVNELPEYK
jgi:hypothetical protein